MGIKINYQVSLIRLKCFLFLVEKSLGGWALMAHESYSRTQGSNNVYINTYKSLPKEIILIVKVELTVLWIKMFSLLFRLYIFL